MPPGLASSHPLASPTVRLRDCVDQPEGNRLGLTARDVNDRDVPRTNLVLGQLRSRSLPIPTAIFAERLARTLVSMRNEKRSAANSR